MWIVKACPQRKDKPRFSPNSERTFQEKGKFVSDSKKWRANLNDKVLGGILTVRVKVEKTTFVRQVVIKGSEPGKAKIISELARYDPKALSEVNLAKKIFEQETKYLHFFSDSEPLVSFDNGYGLGQATTPVPSFEQVWNWKAHVEYIIEVVIKEKRGLAKKYLDKHGAYSDEDLDMETLVYYNGANFHYLVWDETKKKWRVNENVLCDPEQSNKGWDMRDAKNQNKTLLQLRAKEGAAPKYTGRCYADHIKNHQ